MINHRVNLGEPGEIGRGGGAKKFKKSASFIFEVSCSQRRCSNYTAYCYMRRTTTLISLPISMNSKGFALTWYRARTLYSLPARPFAAPCRDGRSATRCYRAAREPPPPACQQLSRVRTVCAGGSSGGGYQVKARYQVRANALLCV